MIIVWPSRTARHLGHAAPHDRAVPARRALVGIEVRAHRGVDAVGGDQQRGHRTVAHASRRRDRAMNVARTPSGSARSVATRWPRWMRSPPTRRAARHRAALAAGRRGGSRSAASGSRRRRRAARPRCARRAWCSRRARRAATPARVERRAQAQLVELAHRVRQQVDADAERRGSPRPTRTPHGEARGVQAERGGQPADAGAGDQDFVVRFALRGHRCSLITQREA